MGMPNSLGNFAWGRQIPCSVGDTKSTEGVPKSLGDWARGRGAGSPMTPSLEPRLSVPDCVSQLWRKIGGKAWTDFSRDTVAP